MRPAMNYLFSPQPAGQVAETVEFSSADIGSYTGQTTLNGMNPVAASAIFACGTDGDIRTGTASSVGATATTDRADWIEASGAVSDATLFEYKITRNSGVGGSFTGATVDGAWHDMGSGGLNCKLQNSGNSESYAQAVMTVEIREKNFPQNDGSLGATHTRPSFNVTLNANLVP